jgi:hypothetical protein
VSRYYSNNIPKDCLEALDGSRLEDKFGETHTLVSTDEDRTPRICMLSAGEVLAVEPKLLRVALWPNSQTVANLKRSKRVLFCFVRSGRVLYLKGAAHYICFDALVGTELFEIAIERVEIDEHPGMPVIHGIGYTCAPEMRAPTIEHWKKVLASLKQPPRGC